jgi:hypothetical protein
VPEGLGSDSEKRSIGGDGGIEFGEDLVEGADGPAERVGGLVPLGDELEDGPLEGREVGGRPTRYFLTIGTTIVLCLQYSHDFGGLTLHVL